MIKKYKILWVSLVAQSLLFGQYQYAGGNQNGSRIDNGKQVIGKTIPEKSPRGKYPDRERDREEMKTQERAKVYQKTQEAFSQRQKILSGAYSIHVSMSPEYRILRGMDSIKLSPAFVSTIKMPKDFVITDAIASFPATHFVFSQNMLRVQPKMDSFQVGNIQLVMSDGKRNYDMTIYVEKYFQHLANMPNTTSANASGATAYPLKKAGSSEEERFYQGDNPERGKYKDAINQLSLSYQYIVPKVISGQDAIILYERMVGKKGINIENGDYVSFIYNGITYRIVRDDRQGTLIYGKKAYRIENSTQPNLAWQ